jgi:hypothetical protein
LIEKCLGNGKAVIKSKSQECILLVFQVSSGFEESKDTIIELLKNKNAKVRSYANTALALLVENYGVNKVDINHYTDLMLENAQNPNTDCKKSSYEFYKAVYKWKGDDTLHLIRFKLKNIQIEDLTKEFKNVDRNNKKRLTNFE